MIVHYRIRYRDLSRLKLDTTRSPTDLIVDEYVPLADTLWGATRTEQLISYCMEQAIDIATVIVIEDSQGNKLHSPLIKDLESYLNNKLFREL